MFELVGAVCRVTSKKLDDNKMSQSKFLLFYFTQPILVKSIPWRVYWQTVHSENYFIHVKGIFLQFYF